MPNITYTNANGVLITEKAPVSYTDATLVDSSQLVLSKSVAEATFHMLKAEIFDKTFVLMIIFTISWTNWQNDKEVKSSHYHQSSGEVHLKKDRVNINPLRIFMTTSIGVIAVDWWAIAK